MRQRSPHEQPRGRDVKSRVVMIVAALVGSLVVGLAPAGSVGACSCATITVEGAVADGAAAFVGVARSENSGAPRSWTFEVVEAVTGELGDQVEVWQAMGGECGPVFEIGELVGVVLRRDGDRFVTDDCGGVWLPDELRAPGTLAAPTGSGAAALVATGRTGEAMLATYDAGGNLLAWGLGEADDVLMHPASARDRQPSPA
jgi:hypothetical protein